MSTNENKYLTGNGMSVREALETIRCFVQECDIYDNDKEDTFFQGEIDDEYKKIFDYLKKEFRINRILKQTHSYKLTITDMNEDIDVKYYLTDNMYLEVLQLLRDFYKKTD